MASCDAAHKVLESKVDQGIHVGELPVWTCVGGKVAYRVIQGSYEQLPGAWATFPQRALETARSPPRGPPGDVYVCSPMDHAKDPGRLLTVLYLPVQ